MNILVLGCSGGGKSTTARKLAQILNLRIVHLDLLFWKPGWVARDVDETTELVKKELEIDGWVIDGNHHFCYLQRVENADILVWVDISRWRCLFNVCFRVLKYRGKVRPSMTEGCDEKVDVEFLSYIWNFRNTKGLKIAQLFEDVKETKQTFRLTNYNEVNLFLEKLEKGESFSINKN